MTAWSLSIPRSIPYLFTASLRPAMLRAVYLLLIIFHLASARLNARELKATTIHVRGCTGGQNDYLLFNTFNTERCRVSGCIEDGPMKSSYYQCQLCKRASHKMFQFWTCDHHCQSDGNRPLTHAYVEETPFNWQGT
ncbi:hypothetical protein PCANC_16274 [Puccinia coronata f. sp. avenae]|uniref:Uncharacterized protein n=1 Tax=Puccinia coronata f. sp. avenae TaxID=200324 RepID=A0A2N5U7N7_9BASI|nr:hypothetical protein PCANC_16274 [Puccinia coronata f. sp. avenae]